MVMITNGSNVLNVTRGAFENMYKCQGYKEVKQEKGANDIAPSVPVSEPEVQVSEEDKFAKELETKPLSQWTKAEVKKYATIKNIDLSGTKNVAEAKARISSVVEV